jgi:hypothetical protein
MRVLPRHLRVDIKSLNLDAPFQREIVRGHPISRQGYDESLEGEIVVAVVRGESYVVDGKQRVFNKLAALAAGAQLQYDIRAVVYDGVTMEFAAALFVTYDAARKKLTPFEVYRARLVSGDSVALSVERTARKHSLVPSSGGGPMHRLTAVGAAQKIVSKYGEDTLDRVFRIQQDLYPGQNPKDRMIIGLADALMTVEADYKGILDKYGDEYLIRRLQKYAGGSYMALLTQVRNKALMAPGSPYTLEDRNKDRTDIWAYGILRIMSTRYYK